MKQIFIQALLTLILFCSCSQGQRRTEQGSNIDNELLGKLNGEWSVVNKWTDSLLTFNNKKDKNFKQEIFPSYNTIVFNQKDKTIEVNTYGEFGCGTGAIENLEIYNSKWELVNGFLKLNFDYSDYSGNHKIENTYIIERKNQQLILKRRNEK
ncbi:hypothetical protein PG637_10900 [Riemerella anatipestifer]|nr:hypothetical protein [Riemerella anatipestifer]MDY3326171.1 hypothetical protein [Riemerella anatipestifer]MDY3354521.1 hypothetical protein [Riemerella anatipestifer]